MVSRLARIPILSDSPWVIRSKRSYSRHGEFQEATMRKQEIGSIPPFFGQFDFFWKKEKKMLQRMGLMKKDKK